MEFYWTPRTRGRQARVSFTLGANAYDLAVTDPSWEERIKDLDEGAHKPESLGLTPSDDIALTISLGEPYGSYHYKLVAAIIHLPPSEKGDTGVPQVVLKPDDLERLGALEGPYGFSCNQYGEVWTSVVHGLTPPTQRHHLGGQDRVLDGIVRHVIEARPIGGRFYLADDGVRLSGSHELVAVFRFQ